MTIQEMSDVGNCRLVEKAWVEGLSSKNIEQFVNCHEDSVVLYDPTLPKPLKGQGELRNWVTGLYGMFPDYHVDRVRSFGQDEWVCLEAEESGTMRGPLHGPGGHNVPPTNKSFRMQSSIVCKTIGGKISEVRLYYDVLGLMGQLGLGP
jgi:SnoaL-like polyketide cyclase